jgi:hypothetical protein
VPGWLLLCCAEPIHNTQGPNPHSFTPGIVKPSCLGVRVVSTSAVAGVAGLAGAAVALTIIATRRPLAGRGTPAHNQCQRRACRCQ